MNWKFDCLARKRLSVFAFKRAMISQSVGCIYLLARHERHVGQPVLMVLPQNVVFLVFEWKDSSRKSELQRLEMEGGWRARFICGVGPCTSRVSWCGDSFMNTTPGAS